MKLGELAAQLECQLEGEADLEITGVAGMDEAHAHEVTFLSNPKYLPKLHTTQAAAIIAGPDVDTLGKPVLTFCRSLPVICSGARSLLPTPQATRRNSSHGRHRRRRQAGAQSLHWPLCCDRGRR